MCLWCYYHILDAASRDNLNARCPNCRSEYDQSRLSMSSIDAGQLQCERRRLRPGRQRSLAGSSAPGQSPERQPPRAHACAKTLRSPPRPCGASEGSHPARPPPPNGSFVDGHFTMADQPPPPALAPSRGGAGGALPERAALQGLRVVQSNLVYVVGLASDLCDEALLSGPGYFGRFGQIVKLAAQRVGSHSGCAHVTFGAERDAVRCIRELDGRVWRGRVLRLSFGTTKFCFAFLKGAACPVPDCLYLHAPAPREDCLTREQVAAGDLPPRFLRLLGEDEPVAGHFPERKNGPLLNRDEDEEKDEKKDGGVFQPVITGSVVAPPPPPPPRRRPGATEGSPGAAPPDSAEAVAEALRRARCSGSPRACSPPPPPPRRAHARPAGAPQLSRAPLHLSRAPASARPSLEHEWPSLGGSAQLASPAASRPLGASPQLASPAASKPLGASAQLASPAASRPLGKASPASPQTMARKIAQSSPEPARLGARGALVPLGVPKPAPRLVPLGHVAACRAPLPEVSSQARPAGPRVGRGPPPGFGGPASSSSRALPPSSSGAPPPGYGVPLPPPGFGPGPSRGSSVSPASSSASSAREDAGEGLARSPRGPPGFERVHVR